VRDRGGWKAARVYFAEAYDKLVQNDFGYVDFVGEHVSEGESTAPFGKLRVNYSVARLR
jgi:hypothetical protein